ncbi:esterase-like activity of phytase family protein [Palleronia marisminoris]|uniref:esterase-like activity of phytase family protein n=1 Tax=Palleronia marisminoris TaxID=315423 RepID=UPI00159356D0|nr:esterase-like activity of phytase family protein [Palleronia marisminoris]
MSAKGVVQQVVATERTPQNGPLRCATTCIEDASHAIGAFNIIEGARALIIERDGGQGTAKFPDNPAPFKRIYLVNLERMDDAGVIEKIAYIDLLNVADVLAAE